MESTTWRLFGFHDDELKLDRHYLLHSKIDGHVYTQDERFAAALSVFNHKFTRSRRFERKVLPGALLVDVVLIRRQCKKAYLDPDIVKHAVGGSGLRVDA